MLKRKTIIRRKVTTTQKDTIDNRATNGKIGSIKTSMMNCEMINRGLAIATQDDIGTTRTYNNNIDTGNIITDGNITTKGNIGDTET